MKIKRSTIKLIFILALFVGMLALANAAIPPKPYVINGEKISSSCSTGNISVMPHTVGGGRPTQYIEFTNEMSFSNIDLGIVHDGAVKNFRIWTKDSTLLPIIYPNQSCTLQPIAFPNGTVMVEDCVYNPYTTYKIYDQYEERTSSLTIETYQGQTIEWLDSIQIPKGETKKFKVKYDVPPHKFYKWGFVVKRDGQPLSAAITSGQYHFLDPWANASYANKRNITNTTTKFTGAVLVNGTGGFYQQSENQTSSLIWVKANYSNLSVYYNDRENFSIYEADTTGSPFSTFGRGENQSPADTFLANITIEFYNESGTIPDKSRGYNGNPSDVKTLTALVEHNPDAGSPFGTSFKFSDASSAVLENFTATVFNSELFSIEVWYNQTANENAVLVGTSQSHPVTFIVGTLSDGRAYCQQSCNPSGPARNPLSTTTTGGGRWWQQVCVFNRSQAPSGQIQLYLNGELEANSSSAYNCDINKTGKVVYVGTDGTSYLFNGHIGLIRIYDQTVLTGAQIEEIYNSTIRPTKYNHLLRNETGSAGGTPTPPTLNEIKFFNGTTQQTNRINFSSLINDSNLVIEINGTNTTSIPNITVNVTGWYANDTTHYVIRTVQTLGNGSFRLNSSAFENLTRYGQYNITVKVNDSNGTTTNTTRFNITNQMVKNQTMTSNPAAPNNGSTGVTINISYTDDYGQSVQCNATLRRNGSNPILLNKTNFTSYATSCVSIGFNTDVLNIWNISVDLMDGNQSNISANYTLNITSTPAASEDPPGGSGGGAPTVPTGEEEGEESDGNVTGGGGGRVYVPSPVTEEIGEIAPEDAGWTVVPLRGTGSSQTYLSFPDDLREGAFRVINNRDEELHLTRICLGDLCDKVEFQDVTLDFVIPPLTTETIFFRYNTNGLSYGDEEDWVNVLQDDDDLQKVFKVIINISPFAFFGDYFLPVIIGLLVAGVVALIMKLLFLYVLPKTKPKTQVIIISILSFIVFVVVLFIDRILTGITRLG